MPTTTTPKGGRQRASQNGAAPDPDDLSAIREAADKIKKDNSYDGMMTGPILRALEGLLHLPIPDRYIETTEPTRGKPYESTGIRSAQVQVDRMNAVLGQNHWRVLTHYRDGGIICKTVVIVGNGLHKAALDSDGDLDADDWSQNAPDILVVREGYGGHARGSSPGDTWKGAETNALKRTLARFGPGAEVYRLDFEDHPEMPPMAQVAQPQAAPEPVRGQEMTEEQAEEALAALVTDQAASDDLRALRQAANEAMLAMPEPPSALLRLQLVVPRADDPHQLKELISRAATTPEPQAQ